MERIIKFRGWNHIVGRMSEPHTLQQLYELAGIQFQNLTFLQFTGLTDKNGKEIYEGDFVECKMSYNGGFLPHMGQIVYMEKFGAFATKNLGGETLLHNHLLNSFEVIGNIHENPELTSTNN